MECFVKRFTKYRNFPFVPCWYIYEAQKSGGQWKSTDFVLAENGKALSVFRRHETGGFTLINQFSCYIYQRLVDPGPSGWDRVGWILLPIIIDWDGPEKKKGADWGWTPKQKCWSGPLFVTGKNGIFDDLETILSVQFPKILLISILKLSGTELGTAFETEAIISDFSSWAACDILGPGWLLVKCSCPGRHE